MYFLSYGLKISCFFCQEINSHIYFSQFIQKKSLIFLFKVIIFEISSKTHLIKILARIHFEFSHKFVLFFTTYQLSKLNLM